MQLVSFQLRPQVVGLRGTIPKRNGQGHPSRIFGEFAGKRVRQRLRRSRKIPAVVALEAGACVHTEDRKVGLQTVSREPQCDFLVFHIRPRRPQIRTALVGGGERGFEIGDITVLDRRQRVRRHDVRRFQRGISFFAQNVLECRFLELQVGLGDDQIASPRCDFRLG